jgi:FkbM family methyltransferase
MSNIREKMTRALLKVQREGERENFRKPALALGEEMHQRNVERLFRNLDEGAKKRLSAILARREKILDESVTSYRELYSPEEWEEYSRFEEFGAKVRQVGGAYRYQDFKLPIREFVPGVFLYEHGLPLLKTLNKLGDGTVIDGGCAHGDSILVFRKFTRNPIYAFEPHPGMYGLALKTLEMNASLAGSGITVENLALGDKAGAEVLLTDTGSSSRIDHTLEKGIRAVTVTLDDYVAQRGLQIGLIKLDIEGYEQNCLRGAVETVKTQKPILIISIYHSYDDFFQIKPFIENLDLGYKFDFFKGIDASVWASTMLLCEMR